MHFNRFRLHNTRYLKSEEKTTFFRYDIKAPSVFKVRQVGKTLVNRTAGTRIASDGLKGRVYEVSLADLQSENDAERSFRKFKLICEDVQV